MLKYLNTHNVYDNQFSTQLSINNYILNYDIFNIVAYATN